MGLCLRWERRDERRTFNAERSILNGLVEGAWLLDLGCGGGSRRGAETRRFFGAWLRGILDFGIEPFAAGGDSAKDNGLDEEVESHEDPDDVEGEVGEGVVEGEADNAEKDEAGEGPCHDGFGGTCSAEGGFHDDGGSEGGLEDAADEDEGDGDGDELGGLGVGFGENEANDDFGRDEEKGTDGTHEDEGVDPSGAQGFHGHGGVVGAEVLADEGGGGSADGEAGEEAEGLDPNGDEVGP